MALDAIQKLKLQHAGKNERPSGRRAIEVERVDEQAAGKLDTRQRRQYNSNDPDRFFNVAPSSLNLNTDDYSKDVLSGAIFEKLNNYGKTVKQETGGEKKSELAEETSYQSPIFKSTANISYQRPLVIKPALITRPPVLNLPISPLAGGKLSLKPGRLLPSPPPLPRLDQSTAVPAPPRSNLSVYRSARRRARYSMMIEKQTKGSQRQLTPSARQPSFQDDKPIRELIARVRVIKTKGAIQNVGKRIDKRRQNTGRRSQLTKILDLNSA